ncbi:MAG TPA: mycofactocin-associated electron transfer flavoprotein alpha subunit [Ilumatobacteraceae bacterium]
MLAVIVVRDGQLPAGADETISECGGRALLVGSGTTAAAEDAKYVSRDLNIAEVGEFAPGAWAVALATHLADEAILVLPASPDGRDLAPRLAARLQRPLHATALSVSPSRVDVVRNGGTELHSIAPTPTFVATLQPGIRGIDVIDGDVTVRNLSLAVPPRQDATIEDTLEADAATIDLAEAGRIVAGGAGLDAPERFDQLAALGSALQASVGATRVVTDRGWIAHERQIGTTGVIVDPRLYVAFGISGAVQHTSGLGRPDHIISINTDAHCPMMQLADLAVVADANAVLDELLQRLPREADARRG